MDRTVRLAKEPVPGCIATVNRCDISSMLGPRRVMSMTAAPWPPAVTGITTLPFALASSFTVVRSASALTMIGP
jgi:hypothetical protein